MLSSKIAKNSVLAALAIIFGYIESLLPIAPIPGIKLGISNIVILYALKTSGKADAFFIMLIKVIVSSLLFSGLNTFFYALSGGILSWLIMTAALRLGFSLPVCGLSGGVFHNIGQLCAAAVILKSTAAFSYLPVLLISGAVCGFIIGSVCNAFFSRINR